MHEIIHYERQGLTEDGRIIGRFRASGVRPRFADKLAVCGLHLLPVLFGEPKE